MVSPLRLLTEHCLRLNWTLRSRLKRGESAKGQRPSSWEGNGQVARGNLSSKKNIITFTFGVTPKLITATGNSCWEQEVFSHQEIIESLALEPTTVSFKPAGLYPGRASTSQQGTFVQIRKRGPFLQASEPLAGQVLPSSEQPGTMRTRPQLHNHSSSPSHAQLSLSLTWTVKALNTPEAEKNAVGVRGSESFNTTLIQKSKVPAPIYSTTSSSHSRPDPGDPIL